MSGAIFFGPGSVIVTANNVANPTPFTLLSQKITVMEKANLVELHGSNQYPIAVGGGKKSIDISIESATFSFKALGASYFAQTPTAGGTFPVRGEAHLGSTTPFTVVAPNAGTFVADEGVIYGSGANNGNVLTRVASAPTVGQYSVTIATGIYVFAAADSAATLLLSYDYSTVTATVGQSIVRLNQLLGTSANSSVAITGINPTNNLLQLLTLPNVAFVTLDIVQSDLEKFWMPKLTGKAFVNAAGSPYTWSVPDTQ